VTGWTELERNAVSVTCWMLHDDKVEWSVTRESGVASLCSFAGCEQCAGWRREGGRGPTGYLIVKVSVGPAEDRLGSLHVGFMPLRAMEMGAVVDTTRDEGQMSIVRLAAERGTCSVVESVIKLQVQPRSIVWRSRCTAVRADGGGFRPGWSDGVGQMRHDGRLWHWCAQTECM
jgi:hypothetical protein